VTSVDALNAALAVEHATLYAYGVAGAHAGVKGQALARSAYAAHRAWRDRLAGLVRDAGGTPVPADAAYTLERPVTDLVSAMALATSLEDGCAVAYEQLVVAAEEAPLRVTAANALVECATRATSWRVLAGDPQPLAFPGRGA
jgi:hypothetical protein